LPPNSKMAQRVGQTLSNSPQDLPQQELIGGKAFLGRPGLGQGSSKVRGEMVSVHFIECPCGWSTR
jgi:hypothetical protein